MMKRRLFIPLMLLSLLLIPTGVIWAAPLDTVVGESDTVNNDIAVFGENLTIEAGATVNGDVVVFGGNADIKGHINGDLAVFGGDVDVASRVDGDIVMFGGNLEAMMGSSLRGDCVLIGGNFDNSGDSDFGCSSAGTIELDIPDLPEVGNVGSSFLGGFAGAIGSAVFAGILAFVIASAVPQHMQQVEQTMRRYPAASGGVGLLTAIAVPAIIALLVPISLLLLFVCVGILGFPLMLVLGLAESHTNFIMCELPGEGGQLVDALTGYLFDEAGIVVGPVREPGLENFIRFSV
ncbi:MAG: hypothetical protein AAF614_43940, partial [Chloroflexota bacterium]